MSSLVNIALFTALVTTSVCVTAMYLKLRRLNSYHVEYKRILDQTAAALASASAAVQMLNQDGKSTLVALSERIEEAKSVLSEMNAAEESNAPGTERLKSANVA